jgi:hypothetical protein
MIPWAHEITTQHCTWGGWVLTFSKTIISSWRCRRESAANEMKRRMQLRIILPFGHFSERPVGWKPNYLTTGPVYILATPDTVLVSQHMTRRRGFNFNSKMPQSKKLCFIISSSSEDVRSCLEALFSKEYYSSKDLWQFLRATTVRCQLGLLA